jgi:TPM domain
MMPIMKIFFGLILATLFSVSAFSQEAKINDAAKVLSRVDLERIAFALQDLRERANIEGSVQILNKIEDEYPRPLTARDLAILILAPGPTIRINIGSELKGIFPEDRVAAFQNELLTPAVQEKRYADGVTDILKRFTEVGYAEGGVVDAEKVENGKALALVIAICSATVLMFLWMLLFMNRFVGEKIPLKTFQWRIIGAHLAALLGLVGAYILEIQMGLGIIGMLIIPVIFILQIAMLFTVFRRLLPAVGKG